MEPCLDRHQSCPDAMNAATSPGVSIAQVSIEDPLFELADVRASQINCCDYCPVVTVLGTKLSPPDEELYRRVDEVLHYMWDPIGVSGIPIARDEYYPYLPHVFILLKASVKVDSIAKYLFEVSTHRMGVKENLEKDTEVARILLDWKERIDAEHSLPGDQSRAFKSLDSA